MEYGIGRPGRVIVARLFEGEDVYASIEEIARKENVRCGSVLVTGGIRRAEVVVGPKQEEPELVGDFRTFHGPGEVLGIGTLFWDDSGPKLHLHGALGRGEQTMVGCPEAEPAHFSFSR